MKISLLRKLFAGYHAKLTLGLISSVVVGASAFGLSTNHIKTTPKPVTVHPTASSHRVAHLKRTTPVTKPVAKPTTTPAPAPTPAPPTPLPAAPKPAVKPTPKPAADVTQSPAAVAQTNTTPGDGVSGLSPTNNSPPPATTTTSTSTSSSTAGSPTPCSNTPGSYASTNWAGYFKTGCTFTAVSGKWTVPTPTTTSTTDTTTDAAWIGIGGVNTNDLIQVGTEETVDTDGTINAAVFYELLPDAPHYPTTITVSPGDHISASLSETTTNTWLISIANTSTGKTFTKTVSYTSSYSSVEWIEEDPSYADGTLVPFDNFGTINFTGASATGNGTLGTLSDASSIKMVDNNYKTIALPGAVSGANTDSFSVTRQQP